MLKFKIAVLGTALIFTAAGLTACGNDAGNEADLSPAVPKGKAAAKALALSMAPIDVVKTRPHGIVSEDFDPCIYDVTVLVAYFGYPADTYATQKPKGRSCHYALQRVEVAETGPFSSFYSGISLSFDHGNWKSIGDPVAYDADIDLWFTKVGEYEKIEGLGARTIKTKSPYTNAHSEMLSGYPVGGHWTAVLNASGNMENPWPEAVHADQNERFRALLANLNSRLQTPSTVLPE